MQQHERLIAATRNNDSHRGAPKTSSAAAGSSFELGAELSSGCHSVYVGRQLRLWNGPKLMTICQFGSSIPQSWILGAGGSFASVSF